MARNTLIEFRRGTAAQWTAANPTLASGEPGYETDTDLLKIGDGATAWNSLAYFAGSGAGITTIDSPGGTIGVTNPAGPTTDLDLPASGVSAGAYGDSTHVAAVTVDAEGRVTSASAVAIAGGSGGKLTVPSAGFGNVVSALPIPALMLSASAGFASAPLLIGNRVVVPFDGTLHDFAVYIVTSSGNIEVGIYDTATTTRNRLWTSGSVACGAAGAWQTVGDPALAVSAGDEIDLTLSVKNTTIGFARTLPTVTAALKAPTNYLTGGGGTPWLGWAAATVSSVTATLAESAMAVNNNLILMACRIV